MHEGKVIFFNEKSKFGFIKENTIGEDYYFRIKRQVEKIDVNDQVIFELQKAKKGLEAINVRVVAKANERR